MSHERIHQPLAEVFGHLTTDMTARAEGYRTQRLCPYNNIVPNCTKDKAKDPLGVCSIYYENDPVITCPIRFREDWLVADDAASFFFDKGIKWSSLTEVRLYDSKHKSAGSIDLVLVSYNDNGQILDFGALEIQAVYISGNVRDPFKYYMDDPLGRSKMDWSKEPNYPQPDFLSSSRKRLAPQLVYKGGILHTWNKKIAVALNQSFFSTLPTLQKVSKTEADIAWFIYDLVLTATPEQQRYQLKKVDEVYTKFEPALSAITTPLPGKVDDFIKLLQEKLDEQLETSPDTNSIDKPF